MIEDPNELMIQSTHAMQGIPVETPGNFRSFSNFLVFGSFSIDVLNQLASDKLLAPEEQEDSPTSLREESLIQSTNKRGSSEQNEEFSTEESNPLEKKQKIVHPIPSSSVTTNFREWTKWIYPAVYTLTLTFGDPEKPVPKALKNCKKDTVLRHMNQRKFSDIQCYGLKSELIRRLQTDLPSVTFEIDGREDISRCLATAFHQWDWPMDMTYSVKIPFHGNNVLGVKHYRDIFGPSFFDTKFSNEHPNHSKIIRAAVRRELPYLSSSDQDDLIQKILRNEIQGEILSNERQLSGCTSISGHRYRETNGFERIFYLDLHTLDLHKGDKLMFTLNYDEHKILLTMTVDDIQRDIPPLPELTFGGIEYNLPTRARVVKKSWHPNPKPTDIQVFQIT